MSDTPTTVVARPPSPAKSSTTVSSERPIMAVIPPVRRVVGIGLPVRDGGPRRRVRGLEQVDREQVLRVLDLAAAAPVEEYHAPTEYDLLRTYNDAPESTAFGRRRLREQRERVA